MAIGEITHLPDCLIIIACLPVSLTGTVTAEAFRLFRQQEGDVPFIGCRSDRLADRSAAVHSDGSGARRGRSIAAAARRRAAGSRRRRRRRRRRRDLRRRVGRVGVAIQVRAVHVFCERDRTKAYKFKIREQREIDVHEATGYARILDCSYLGPFVPWAVYIHQQLYPGQFIYAIHVYE